MNKKKSIVIFGFATALVLILLFYFDNQISASFGLIRNYYLNQIFLGIRFLDNEIFVAIFLTLILLWKREKREWILPLWITVFMTALASFVLKYSIQRPRPFVQGVISLLPGITDKISYHTFDFSFPSFDVALVFCALPIVWKFFPRFRNLWIVFGVLVGLSRIYLGFHFASDVIAGGLLGYVIGMLVMKTENENGILRRFYRKIFK